MDIMKKFGLFLIAAIAVTAFTSCNDDDGGEPLRTLITTVRTLDGGDYYFQRDNGETLYPGNKSRVPGYKPDPDKTQRVIIWFTLQNGSCRLRLQHRRSISWKTSTPALRRS